MQALSAWVAGPSTHSFFLRSPLLLWSLVDSYHHAEFRSTLHTFSSKMDTALAFTLLNNAYIRAGMPLE